MATVHIGNTTKQHAVFMYRLPENPRLFELRIPIGRQERLLQPNLEGLELDAVVKQLERFGAVPEDRVGRAKGFVGLTYNLSRPVKAESLEAGVEHNAEVLEQRGHEMRVESAVAMHHAAASAVEGGATVTGSQVEIIEQTKRGEPTGLKQKIGVGKPLDSGDGRRKR